MKYFILYIQPLKMELIEGSETSANHNRTPGKHPKEYIQYSKHGESLKSRKWEFFISWTTINASRRSLLVFGCVYDEVSLLIVGSFIGWLYGCTAAVTVRNCACAPWLLCLVRLISFQTFASNGWDFNVSSDDYDYDGNGGGGGGGGGA